MEHAGGWMSTERSDTYRNPGRTFHDPAAAEHGPGRASAAPGRIARPGLLVHHGPVARSRLHDAGEPPLEQLLEAQVERPAIRLIAEDPAHVAARERIWEEGERLANVRVHLGSAPVRSRLHVRDR